MGTVMRGSFYKGAAETSAAVVAAGGRAALLPAGGQRDWKRRGRNVMRQGDRAEGAYRRGGGRRAAEDFA